MRMIIQPSAVGMEDGGKAQVRSQVVRVEAEVFQRTGDTGKEQGIERFLVLPGQRS